MAEATDRAVPSEATRSLLTRATEAGRAAEQAVDRFCGLARGGMEAFDAEVVPLGLPDDDYERVVVGCGLREVHGLADRIEHEVASLQQDRAA